VNIRRGLFRLWVVASLLFLIWLGWLSYDEIRSEFKYASLGLPADCGKARGSSGKDYEEDGGLCWYDQSKFRKLFPEYKDLSDEDLSDKLYAGTGLPHRPARPWAKLLGTLGFATGVPLAALALGWSLIWALSGFCRSGTAGDAAKSEATRP